MEKDNWAVLFDFDGVVVDTETQYTRFWNSVGQKYYPDRSDFGRIIKGQTLTQIYESYFKGQVEEQKQITRALYAFEEQMSFDYVPGVELFMDELKRLGVKIAIVTSSDNHKMERAFKAHPHLREKLDCLVTANMVDHSKPHPECFLKASEFLNTVPEKCIVFEDSLNGLEAGVRAGMRVVGLTTTNPPEKIKKKCSLIIDDFTEITVDGIYKKLFQY